jgi:hypothetical protein
MFGRLVVSVALTAVIAHASPALGWNETGHKVVALIAWAELTPAARARVSEILKAHPRYEKDLLARLPDGATQEETARHVFAAASAWPDVVRSRSHPMNFVANHPAWHYIDMPYAFDAQGTAATQPSSIAQMQPASRTADPKDIVEALTKATADLADPAIADRDKAVALCWLLHLGGDIHQPLHACTLVTPEFPRGDQGGNKLLVLRNPPDANSQMNLHQVWDSVAGTYHTEVFFEYLASGLRNDPRYSRERLKDPLTIHDVARWARESHELAIEHVYLRGALQAASADKVRADAKTPVPGLPRGYTERAEQVAIRRLALAGYRTADLVNAALKPRDNAATQPRPH